MAITADGIRTWCSHVDIRYPWSDTLRIIATPESYLFLRNAGTGLMIPKRALDRDADVELRRCVREWAPAGTVQLAPREP